MNKIRIPEISDNDSEIKLNYQGVKLDSLYNSKERELLQFLGAKKIEIENLVNKMSELSKMRKDLGFDITICSLEDDMCNKIKKLQDEVSEWLKNYLAPLSDDEKTHTAEFMSKNGFGLFIIANLEYFGKKFNIELGKMFVEACIENGDSGDIIYNLDKFKGIDYKQLAEALIEYRKGDESKQEKPFEFKGLDDKQLVEALIEYRKGDKAKLEKPIEGLDKKKLNSFMKKRGKRQ